MSEDNSGSDSEHERPLVAKTPVDLQRLKLMKLMKNPEKPVVIPERPKQKGTSAVPEFVRNVMGSSAGAGSGEFHVYRHLRRKEYARQKYIQEKGQKELLDEEYHRKLEENRKKAEEATAKKRAKRLKKKQKLKQKKFKPLNSIVKQDNSNHSESESESSDEEKHSDFDSSTNENDKKETQTITIKIEENVKHEKQNDCKITAEEIIENETTIHRLNADSSPKYKEKDISDENIERVTEIDKKCIENASDEQTIKTDTDNKNESNIRKNSDSDNIENILKVDNIKKS